jgi:cell division protein FtsL
MEFISHCIKRNPNKLEGRATAGMLIIFLVLSLLGWIYLTQASHVATTSRRNQDLEAERARLHQENLELMVEIAEYESVSRLAARAQELGFVAVGPDKADFVAVSLPAPGAPQGTEDITAWTRVPGGQPGVSGVGSTQVRSAGVRSALGGVKSQFTAWVRASGLRSASQ